MGQLAKRQRLIVLALNPSRTVGISSCRGYECLPCLCVLAKDHHCLATLEHQSQYSLSCRNVYSMCNENVSSICNENTILTRWGAASVAEAKQGHSKLQRVTADSFPYSRCHALRILYIESWHNQSHFKDAWQQRQCPPGQSLFLSQFLFC